jgi:hypothetical protein
VNKLSNIKTPIKIIGLTAFLLLSCQTDNEYSQTEVVDLKTFPVIIDTSGVARRLDLFQQNNFNGLPYTHFEYYFIGQVKDTIYLNPSLRFFLYSIGGMSKSGEIISEEITVLDDPFLKYRREWEDNIDFKHYSEVKINIAMNREIKFADYFPVMLTNLNTDTIIIGSSKNIPLKMEAVDSSGNWRAIHEDYEIGCGNGVGYIILPPNECVITLAPIFTGPFKAKLRLTFGENHSEPFIGFINEQQVQYMSEQKKWPPTKSD